MGYRSQVMIAIKDAALQEELLKENEKLQEEVKKCLEDYTDKVERRDGWTLYHWEDIKWYTNSPGYEDVRWLEEFIKGSPWSGQLLRLGEDLGDFETFGEPEDSPFTLSYECKLTYSY